MLKGPATPDKPLRRCRGVTCAHVSGDADAVADARAVAEGVMEGGAPADSDADGDADDDGVAEHATTSATR